MTVRDTFNMSAGVITQGTFLDEDDRRETGLVLAPAHPIEEPGVFVGIVATEGDHGMLSKTYLTPAQARAVAFSLNELADAVERAVADGRYDKPVAEDAYVWWTEPQL